MQVHADVNLYKCIMLCNFINYHVSGKFIILFICTILFLVLISGELSNSRIKNLSDLLIPQVWQERRGHCPGLKMLA